MACLGECLDSGPPPDSILFLPPPPAPSVSQYSPELLLNSTLCSLVQLCETWSLYKNTPDTNDYIELPRKDIDNWTVSQLDETWFLVLVAASVGVLLLGALIAMFLLKCREVKMLGTNECPVRIRNHQPMKSLDRRDCASVTSVNSGKLGPRTEPSIYNTNTQDNRMVWAALTPRGTQHFISENYPSDLVDYGENENHYETIDNFNIQPVLTTHPVNYHTYLRGLTLIKLGREKSSCYNTGFVDYDYEEPTPLIESYQMNNIENRETLQYAILENNGLHCLEADPSESTVKHGLTIRPRVSSPTYIEHPNLPPLNLYPYKSNTLRRNNCINKSNDMMTLPRYS